MKLTIESTDDVQLLEVPGGTPVREWRGVTEAGVPCRLFVCMVAVDETLDVGEFLRDLTLIDADGATPKGLEPLPA